MAIDLSKKDLQKALEECKLVKPCKTWQAALDFYFCSSKNFISPVKGEFKPLWNPTMPMGIPLQTPQELAEPVPTADLNKYEDTISQIRDVIRAFAFEQTPEILAEHNEWADEHYSLGMLARYYKEVTDKPELGLYNLRCLDERYLLIIACVVNKFILMYQNGSDNRYIALVKALAKNDSILAEQKFGPFVCQMLDYFDELDGWWTWY